MYLQAVPGFTLKYLRIGYGQIYGMLLEVEMMLSGQLILIYFIFLCM